MGDNKSVNYFVRGLIVLYSLFLVGIVVVNLQGNTPPSITSGMITVLLLITVLILSESFDNLSIGKILSLTREVKLKDEEIKTTKHENAQLRENLIQLSSTMFQKQTQNTWNINGPLGVVPAKAESKEIELEEEVAENDSGTAQIIPGTPAGKQEGVASSQETAAQTAAPQQGISQPQLPALPNFEVRRRLDKFAIEKYLEGKQLPLSDLIREVEFTSAFQGIDPISDRKIVFDGYIKTPYKEYFLEVRHNSFIMMHMMDRIYVQLAKILFYRQAKKVKAELVVLFSKLPGETEAGRRPGFVNIEKFIQLFQPAIASELLRIETIEFTPEDIKQMEEELKDN